MYKKLIFRKFCFSYLTKTVPFLRKQTLQLKDRLNLWTFEHIGRFELLISSFVMIRLTFEDGHGAVELFKKYHADHLVGKGHR